MAVRKEQAHTASDNRLVSDRQNIRDGLRP
jgi:hypothetical protein